MEPPPVQPSATTAPSRPPPPAAHVCPIHGPRASRSEGTSLRRALAVWGAGLCLAAGVSAAGSPRATAIAGRALAPLLPAARSWFALGSMTAGVAAVPLRLGTLFRVAAQSCARGAGKLAWVLVAAQAAVADYDAGEYQLYLDELQEEWDNAGNEVEDGDSEDESGDGDGDDDG
ncbi:hypothetical protein H9P43_009197 [Blastocladiella emersonii ATCC 22665]|nr:hypothetical protein H9P43_009197 [Blastocladiella emersonii ATCC 22665]